MHRWPLKLQIFQSPRFIPLRYRVILVTSGLLILVLGTLALVLGLIQSRTIKRQLEERGRAIAQSIAAASVQDLLNYNYIALERVANQAAQAPNIVYVAVHDKEGRVAGFSGRPELQGELLSDEVSGRALRSATPLIQQTGGTPGGTPGLDVSIPVEIVPAEYAEDFLLYEMEIKQFSMQEPSPHERAVRLLNLSQQLIIPLLQLLQNQGVTLSFEKLLKLVAKYMQLEELEEVLTFAAPQVEPATTTSGVGNAFTQRTHTRVNQSAPSQSQKSERLVAELANAAGGTPPGGNA